MARSEIRRFSISTNDMSVYHVIEYMEDVIIPTSSGGAKSAGRRTYETEDGLEVVKDPDGTYSIPKLKVIAVDNVAVQ